VTNNQRKYCGDACRLAALAQRSAARRAAGPDGHATWPSEVARLDAPLRGLEDRCELAPVEELAGLRSEISALASRIEQAKARVLTAELAQ
jgi:hypothetical protein